MILTSQLQSSDQFFPPEHQRETWKVVSGKSSKAWTFRISHRIPMGFSHSFLWFFGAQVHQVLKEMSIVKRQLAEKHQQQKAAWGGTSDRHGHCLGEGFEGCGHSDVLYIPMCCFFICLHVARMYGRCRQVCHTWSIWDI